MVSIGLFGLAVKGYDNHILAEIMVIFDLYITSFLETYIYGTQKREHYKFKMLFFYSNQ